jgi:hypothetical protein
MDEVTLEDMGPAAATVSQDPWGRRICVTLTRAQVIDLAAGRPVLIDDIDNPVMVTPADQLRGASLDIVGIVLAT